MPWQQAERLLEAEADDRLKGHVATIRAYAAAHRGDVERTLELANQALELLGEDSPGERGIVFFVLGGIHVLRGEDQAALHGQLGRIRDLGLVLVCVQRTTG